MATLIGESLWTRIPGGSEVYGEDGSIETERVYNGAITGGSGTSGGAASWLDFVDSHPPGTPDPVYGSAALSVAYPTLTEKRGLTAVATIKFVGGKFETGQDATAPQITKRIASLEVDITHPVLNDVVELQYFAWQTTITYTSKTEPSKAGTKIALADTTAIDMAYTPQKLPDGVRAMTAAEIDTATTPSATPKLLSMEITEKGSEQGGKIYETVEVWSMVLEPAS